MKEIFFLLISVYLVNIGTAFPISNLKIFQQKRDIGIDTILHHHPSKFKDDRESDSSSSLSSDSSCSSLHQMNPARHPLPKGKVQNILFLFQANLVNLLEIQEIQ